MTYRIMITVGGTGGHLYPAMALADQLIQMFPEAKIEFIGGGLSKNLYFNRKTYPYSDITASSISFSKPIKSFFNGLKIIKGIYQSLRLLKLFSPDIIVGFGSYHTFPVLLAAKKQKIPFVLHEANRIPGRVNRLLSKSAKIVGVQFPDTKLKGNRQQIRLPLRQGYTEASNRMSKIEARKHFGLAENKTTILIFGGSQGARAINFITSQAILQQNNVQVLHFCGQEISSHHLQALYKGKKIQAIVKEHESRMDLAWQASDLVISRAGACTIAEMQAFEVPGILIPYPLATDDHQQSNAEFMSEDVAGAVLIKESELNLELMRKTIEILVKNQLEKLMSMKRAIRAYNERSSGTPELCDVICDYLKNNRS